LLAENYYNENNYGVSLVAASQSTALDIRKCAEAIQQLADDAGQRQSMGQSGRARAQGTFDWRHIIKAYEELWRDLARRRQSMPAPQPVPAGWPGAHPAYLNPWRMFDSFPTAIYSPEEFINVTMSAAEIDVILKHEMNFFVPGVLVDQNSMRALIESIRAAGTPRIADILAAFPATEHARIWRCIGWMLKHGVCERW
jgi:hypothetical protein